MLPAGFLVPECHPSVSPPLLLPFPPDSSVSLWQQLNPLGTSYGVPNQLPCPGQGDQVLAQEVLHPRPPQC